MLNTWFKGRVCTAEDGSVAVYIGGNETQNVVWLESCRQHTRLVLSFNNGFVFAFSASICGQWPQCINKFVADFDHLSSIVQWDVRRHFKRYFEPIP